MTKFSVRPPWKKNFPLGAGFTFEGLTFGYYRYAGSGFGARLVIVGFEFTMQKMPEMSANMQAQQQIQQGPF